MFSNSYNKKIQQEVLDLNKKFIDHQQKVGRAMVSDANYMLKSGGAQDPWAFTGPGTKEGSGFLSGILGSIGLGQPVSGGECYNADNSSNCGGKRNKPRKAMGKKGKGIFSGLLGDIGLGKPKRGRPRKGGADTSDLVEAESGGKKGKKGKKGKGIFSGLLGDIGLGKPKRGRPRKAGAMTAGKKGKGVFSDLLGDIGLGKPKRGRPRKAGAMTAGKKGKKGKGDIEGGNFLDDIASGFNSVVSPITSVVSNLAPLAPLLALGKPKKSKMGKGITAGKKGLSPWISHCKKWAKDHNMKYPDAIKDPKCKMAYRK